MTSAYFIFILTVCVLFFISENLMVDLYYKMAVSGIVGLIGGLTIGCIVNKELNK